MCGIEQIDLHFAKVDLFAQKLPGRLLANKAINASQYFSRRLHTSLSLCAIETKMTTAKLRRAAPPLQSAKIMRRQYTC